MTLHATQEFVKATINGIQSPDWASPLLAYVRVPNPGLAKLAQPLAFIWGATATDSRVAIPRAGAGFDPTLVPPSQSTNAAWRERPYSMSIWLYGVQNNNDPAGEWKFPVLIEQVCQAMMMVELPQQLTDSKTGQNSVLLEIGENFSWEYDVDRTLADQRLLRNEARIDAQVREMYRF